MMNQWVQAFQIFAKYEEQGHYTYIAAEHDQIFAGPDVSVVSKEDIAKLNELGWYVNEEYNSFRQYV